MASKGPSKTVGGYAATGSRGKSVLKSQLDSKDIGQPGRAPRTGAVSGVGSAGGGRAVKAGNIPGAPSGTAKTGHSSGSPKDRGSIRHGRVPSSPAA